MAITEIPRNEWVKFFDGFNGRHRAWLVNMEIVDENDRSRLEASQLPFGGITPELGGTDEIEILVGMKPGQHISHTVTSPRLVRLHQTPEGADESVDIQSASETVVLRFRSAVLPELVDGL